MGKAGIYKVKKCDMKEALSDANASESAVLLQFYCKTRGQMLASKNSALTVRSP